MTDHPAALPTGAAIAVEVTGSHGTTEHVASLVDAGDPGTVLVPQLVPRGQAARPAVEHLHGARVPLPAEVLARDPDSQVGEAIGVEVARGRRAAESVALLGAALDALPVLVPDLVPRRGPGRRSVQDLHRPGIPHGAHVLARHPCRQIGEAIPIEVERHRRS